MIVSGSISPVTRMKPHVPLALERHRQEFQPRSSGHPDVAHDKVKIPLFDRGQGSRRVRQASALPRNVIVLKASRKERAVLAGSSRLYYKHFGKKLVCHMILVGQNSPDFRASPM